MPHAEISRPASPEAGQRRFALYAWGVLGYNLAVILWGAYVRASGSGAGCGNDWPRCRGQLTPAAPSAATLIEFTHRAMTVLDLVLVVALLVWAFRAFGARHRATLGAALATLFLFTEALIGAALVLLDHVARNPSVNRAYSLSTHLINTLTLLACLALTAWWAGGRPAARPRGPGAWAAAASLGLFMALGVSGAIAALGDTLFPARTLAQGFAQDFNPAAHLFLRLRLWHPVLAACITLWLALYGTLGIARRPDVRLGAGIVMTLAALQLSVGMLNLVLHAPISLQLVHLLMADVLWISLVLFCATLLSEPARES
jgi:heme A synthase